MRVNIKKPKLTQARKRQLAIAGLSASVLAGIVGSAVYVIQSGKAANQARLQQQTKQQITATGFASPQTGIGENSLWMAEEGAKVTDMERKISELELKLARQEEAKQNQQSNAGGAANGPDGLGKPGSISGLGNNGQLPPPPPAGTLPSGTQTAGIPGNTPTERKIVSGNMNDPEPDAAGSTGAAVVAGQVNSSGNRVSENMREAEWVQFKTPRKNIETVEDGGNNTVSRGKFRARDSYIPSGTFFRSVLLGGVDAPTGGEAQNASPHPVLMRVTDFAQLPNRFKYNLRECFITGQAYGDISAERAYIRLDKLSCVGTDGRAIDMPVKGYVAGEDGKTGVRGNLVTKQGQVLANALFAGVLSGLGQGVSDAFKVTSDTAFGSTTSVRGSDQYKAGVASGLGSAADRLAQYYIKLADKVFPVVEVNAGREVDVVLTQGIEIDTSETK